MRQAILPKAAEAVLRSQHSGILREILRPGVLLCIWERAPVPGLHEVLRAVSRSRESLKIVMRGSTASEVATELAAALPSSGLRAENFRLLAEDILRLTDEFREISGALHPRVRLERVEDNGCALFHVDTLPLRMLCTYLGPGMQWLDEDNVRREQLGLRGRSLAAANEAIVRDPQKVNTIPAGHVAIFKGRSWQGHQFTDGLVHRSPPVPDSENYRLRLTIDISHDCAC